MTSPDSDELTLDQPFAPLMAAFPSTAGWQGTHFRYAIRNGHVLSEQKRFDR
jgi:hypothetical protein